MRGRWRRRACSVPGVGLVTPAAASWGAGARAGTEAGRCCERPSGSWAGDDGAEERPDPRYRHPRPSARMGGVGREGRRGWGGREWIESDGWRERGWGGKGRAGSRSRREESDGGNGSRVGGGGEREEGGEGGGNAHQGWGSWGQARRGVVRRRRRTREQGRRRGRVRAACAGRAGGCEFAAADATHTHTHTEERVCVCGDKEGGLRGAGQGWERGRGREEEREEGRDGGKGIEGVRGGLGSGSSRLWERERIED